MLMERIETGIKGLDELLEGGMPFPSVVLVAGEPGAGKTTLAMQSLFHGAKKGEKGVYITALSEPEDQAARFMASYTFYDQAAVDEGLVRFVDVGETLLNDGPHQALEEAVRGHIMKKGVKRVVIDPISPFSYVFNTLTDYRRFLHEFFLIMRGLDTLTFLVAEYSPSEITNTEKWPTASYSSTSSPPTTRRYSSPASR
ncbi:MAG: AAA family ATPase [Euryarchaeota archaeon]|nr:AAA family ATPase [Euryarchaeota archaeon]